MENHSFVDMAIIGLGLRFPYANETSELWDILKNEVECIDKFPDSRRNAVKDYLKKKYSLNEEELMFEKGAYLSEIDKFAYKKFKITEQEARLIDPNQRIFLEVAYEAMENAGYVGERLKDRKIGVYVGSNVKFSRDYISMVEEYERESMAIAYTGNLASIIPSRISYFLDLKGPTMLIDTACSSSMVALHNAILGIRNGDCNAAIVGGISISLFPLKKREDEKIGVDSDDGRARTFDLKANGTGWGEGVGVIMIKPLEEALAQGDNVHAIIKASAINQDGYSMGITIPNMQSQTEVIQRAIELSKVNPERISYIEAHGTGTHIGDPVEIEAIKNAYAAYTEKKQFCGIGSVKTNIGHLQAAAGIAGVIKAVLCLKHSLIVPTLNFVQPNYSVNLEESPVYVVRKATEFPKDESIHYCAVSAFGFSGTNSHVILASAPKQHSSNEIEEKEVVVTISAENKKNLTYILNKYLKYLSFNKEDEISDIAYTSSVGREHNECRVAFIVKNKKELEEKIIIFLSSIYEEIQNPSIYYGFNVIAKKGLEVTEANIISKKEKKKFTVMVEEIFKSNSVKLDDICSLYVSGADICWSELYKEENRKVVSIPVTQFEKASCWVGKDNREYSKLQYNPYWRI